MSEWKQLTGNEVEFGKLVAKEKDCLMLFDNGDVVRYSSDKLPMAIATHFKPITGSNSLLERALEALNKSCTYCENEGLSEHCGACKHGIVIKDIEKHLKGGKE